MKLKGFIFLILLSLTAIAEKSYGYEYVLNYPQGDFIALPMTPAPEIVNKVAKQFSKSCFDAVDGKDAKSLTDVVKKISRRGSCYGQSFAFLLLNGPRTKKMHLPLTEWAARQICWFQAKGLADSFYVRKYIALQHKISEIAGQNDPKVKDSASHTTLFDLMKRLKGPHPQLHQEYQSLIRLDVFLAKLDEKMAKILKSKGLKHLGHKWLGKTQAPISFDKAFRKTLERLSRKDFITDAVFSFDLDLDKPSGHAILVQFKHLRIYDSMRGLYQYGSLQNMFEDLPIPKQKGCNNIWYETFKEVSE